MIKQNFHMQNSLGGIDPLVMSLKAVVEGTLGPSAVQRLEICTTEVLTNIVKHASTKGKDTLIEVALSEAPIALMVEVFDPVGAARFDLRDHAQDFENMDPMAESGRGIGLILKCADDVAYGPSKGRNRIALQFLKQ